MKNYFVVMLRSLAGENKIYLSLLLWLIIYPIYIMRPDQLEQMATATPLFDYLIFIPFLCWLALLWEKELRNVKIHKIINISNIINLSIITLPICIILDYFNAQHAMISGTFMSAGLIMLGIAISSKVNKEKGIIFGILTGIMASGCALYSWEIMYQLIIYLRAGNNIPCESGALLPSMIIAVPFLIMMAMNKFEIDKRIILVFMLFCLSIIAWILMGANTLVIYEQGSWLREDISLPQYIISRLSKLLAVIITSSVCFTLLKCSKPITESKSPIKF